MASESIAQLAAEVQEYNGSVESLQLEKGIHWRVVLESLIWCMSINGDVYEAFRREVEDARFEHEKMMSMPQSERAVNKYGPGSIVC